ncbi:MAG: S9 family peptidase [Glaciecola sp.]|jgi:dipeptidyl aminopeptidase/acylaminoacyl peptidase
MLKQSVIALFMGTALFGTHASTFQIEHLPKVQHSGNITVAPDGSVSAHTVSVPRDILAGDKNARPDTHIYVIRDGQPQLFVGGEGGKTGLQFSADGQTLFFKTKRDDDKHTSLYKIALAGGEAQKVFGFETAMGDYAVHGDKLYFVAKPKDESPDLKDKGFRAYAYEEDQRLAGLWHVDLSADDAQATPLFTEGHVSSIDLAANGKTVVAAVAPTHLVDDSLMYRDLVVIDVATGKATQRIDVPGKLGGFELSADGKHIALHGGTDIHDSSDGVLMVAKAKSGELTQLTADALQHIVDVDWYKGDILAVAHRGVESALVLYDTKGKVERTYNTPDDIVVQSADVGNNTIHVVADSPAHPREIYNVERRKTSKVTNHNAWLNDLELAPQTTFTYTARDGEEIEGLLITPTGEKPADGWPLILTVHGGPEAHFSDGWITRYSNAGQFGAASGYAVYYPNYRGSTGRGVAFAKQHQNDYAGKEFNDLVDGVKALVKAGIVDEDRVGITGGSYGGYASMWGATAQSEHFAASVAFVGISNQVSKFGTSDIPNEMHLVHSLKWPWEDNWMNLLERSPLYHVGKSTTPTLILHGEKDTRVHPSQSMELYRSMKVRTNTPVRLVFYPNEGHGNRFAAAQYDYALRLMRWMDTYLAVDATRNDPMPEFDLGIKARLDAAKGKDTTDSE